MTQRRGASDWTQQLMLSLFVLAGACADDTSDDETQPESQESSTPGTNGEQSEAATTGGSRRSVPRGGPLRCADFLTTAQAKSLGIEDWRESAVENDPLLSLHCTPVSADYAVTMFHGADFDTIVQDIDRAGYEQLEGPNLGSEARWYRTKSVYGVHILSNNGKFVASLLGDDREGLERVATGIAPYIDGK